MVVFSSGCSGIWTPYFTVSDLELAFFNLATALGAFMIMINGVRWILSTQPEEREECKKSIIYVMLALFVAKSADLIVQALYIDALVT